MSLPTLLVIDDNATDRELVRMAVGKDFDITEAISSWQAIDKLKNYDPNVILLDLIIPGDDGLTTVKKLRNTTPKSAIVVYSGSSNPLLLGEAAASGVDMIAQKSKGTISRDYFLLLLNGAIMHRIHTLKNL